MIKAAIFDVDGTLLDSMQMWINFASDFVRYFGKNPEFGLDEKVKYFSLRESCEYLSSNYKIGTPDEVESLSSDFTKKFYNDIVIAKPGAYELCSNLYSNGVKMYIASATYKHLVEAGLKRNKLLDFFDGIITCSDVGCGKDKPDIFIEAMKLLNSSTDDTWIFEDALHAIKTSKSIGLNVCGVYDSTELEHIDEIKTLADIYVTSLTDINYDIINLK